jgi:serine phosphatase RsbU (regulator of sigma subunit)
LPAVIINIIFGVVMGFPVQADTLNSVAADTLEPAMFDVAGPDFFRFDDDFVEKITPDLLMNGEKVIYIRDQWRFMPGDDPDWSNPDMDDSGWEFVSTNLSQAELAFIEWDGIGWFRKHLEVAPELRGKPMALLVDRHLGASEVYLNGEKIFELGRFSSNPVEVESYRPAEPLAIVFPDAEKHVLAVRFINPNVSETGRLTGNNGFRFLLGDWQKHQADSYHFLSVWTGSNMFYLGILLAFSLIHFLLFVFYPVERKNLYFSLFAGGLVILSYLFYRIELASFTFDTLHMMRYMIIAETLVIVFATRFTHSLDEEHSPILVNGMFIAGIIIAAMVGFFTIDLLILRDLVIIVYLVEILRCLFLMVYKKRSGIWVLGGGVLVFITGLVIAIMINFGLVQGSVSTVNMASSSALILSMSIFLSREFATTQRNLESKIVEIRKLSDRAIEQERISKEREIERRLLEAENERKSAELEEARALQLSMLPKKMPSTAGLDIAVYMQTATEVGGDYYDYSLEQDGTLVLALGDATGHGMKAGIMVAAAKSYFHTLVHETDILSMLRRISYGLRNLNMHLMYMGLILAESKGDELTFAIAGMPPVLHFNRCEGRVNSIRLKGLPLGGKASFPYQKQTVKINKGDVVLLMSDGLMELFNQNREMLGEDRIRNVIENSNGYSASDIINELKQLADSWTGGSTPHDDITIMVLKVPEE